jgi:hypothetical protein
VKEQGEERLTRRVNSAMKKFDERDARVEAFMANKLEERKRAQADLSKRAKYIQKV